jgi:hypothetical protein
MRLEILDSLSDPAKPDAENEDRVGWNASAAFVIDGATMLGPPLIDPPASDAAWLAELARTQFTEWIAPERPLRDAVRSIAELAAERFRAAAGDTAERWQFPTASFQAIRLTTGGIETAGLGDCSLFLRDAQGVVTRHGGQRVTAQQARGQEQARARAAVARSGGIGVDGDVVRAGETLAELRMSRARLNAPGHAWTLGIAPAAAEHLVTAALMPVLPAVALVCSDGFADLVDNYGAVTPEGLLHWVIEDGLTPALTELRRIERQIDPAGHKFPRFKRCDDASAVLLRITEA